MTPDMAQLIGTATVDPTPNLRLHAALARPLFIALGEIR